MAELTSIEQQIGLPPGDPKLKMTPRTTELVKKWMIAQGFDEARVMGARDNTLYRAYVKPSCLRQLRSRADYYPPAAKGRTAREPNPMAGPWDVTPAAVPQPIQAAPQPTTDLVGQIAAALGPVIAAQQGLTEYRVIEIIHEHVPAIVRQVVAEMFAEFSAINREE